MWVDPGTWVARVDIHPVVVEEEESAMAMDAVACLEAAGGDSAMA
jgi:hypothetical protein